MMPVWIEKVSIDTGVELLLTVTKSNFPFPLCLLSS